MQSVLCNQEFYQIATRSKRQLCYKKTALLESARKLRFKNQHISVSQCSKCFNIDNVQMCSGTTELNGSALCITVSVGKWGLFFLSSIQRVNICLILVRIKTSACSQSAARDVLPVADTLEQENVNWTATSYQRQHSFLSCKQSYCVMKIPFYKEI